MASNDPVVQILEVMPPDTLYATIDARLGGSTPAEAVTVHDFDASAIEYLDFKCLLVKYDGNGLTFTIVWSASSATTGVTRWEIAVRHMPDDTVDVDASQTYDFNTVDATTASASGEVSYDTITFTNGADMDSWVGGEVAIVRLRRNASHANDTMTGDAELWSLSGRES